MALVLPGANSLTVPLPIGRPRKVAAGVEGQGVRTIEPGEGGRGRGVPRANSLTVSSPAWRRRGCRWGRTPGPGYFSPLRVAVGVVLPGRTRSPCRCPRVGHEEVAAGVEGQGLGLIQSGEGGGGRGAPRGEFAHRSPSDTSRPTQRLPPESTAKASGIISPVRVAVAVVLPARTHSPWLRILDANGHLEVAVGIDGQGMVRSAR